MNKLLVLLVGLVILVAGCVSQQNSDSKNQCSKIDDKAQRDACYSETVKSQTILFKDCVKDGNPQSTCRNENVKSDLINACDKITDQNTKDLCYNTLVFVYNDANLCANIADKDTKNKCLLFKVNQLYDCKLFNGTLPCRLEDAHIDKSYCNTFDDGNLTLFCLSTIEEKGECKIDSKYILIHRYKVGVNETEQRVSLKLNCFGLINKAQKFTYEKAGKVYVETLYTELEPSMTWIRDNLPEDAIISAWWDYGHMIRGIGNRNVIIYEPSEEISDTFITFINYFFPPEGMPTLFENVSPSDMVIDAEERDFSSNKDIKNTALLLTTTDPKEAISLMKEYNSEYILVRNTEYKIASTFYKISGISADNIISVNGVSIAVNLNSVFYRILKQEELDGFEKVYSDASVVIYKVK